MVLDYQGDTIQALASGVGRSSVDGFEFNMGFSKHPKEVIRRTSQNERIFFGRKNIYKRNHPVKIFIVFLFDFPRCCQLTSVNNQREETLFNHHKDNKSIYELRRLPNAQKEHLWIRQPCRIQGKTGYLSTFVDGMQCETWNSEKLAANHAQQVFTFWKPRLDFAHLEIINTVQTQAILCWYHTTLYLIIYDNICAICFLDIPC